MGSFALPALQSPPLVPKSSFLGKPPRTHHLAAALPSKHQLPAALFDVTAKFNLLELLGGRGLCNGEKGIKKELQTPAAISQSPASDEPPTAAPPPKSSFGEGAFEKELLGLTGGFPGGEKGLKEFIARNPPPKMTGKAGSGDGVLVVSKPKTPELPLFLPGMIVIVKNPENPFHMYCGIVQRVTDGKAGVLFEGGNWDKLLTFRLNELERREKGPPMTNPKSAVLEALVEKKD